ncbi:hypothetical protein VTJ83DRAFT_3657 [Remersonia thermophila]|uniref:P-loop containing nucleoside triphosphate hydrolase protein n=1 Tax=Remersonia thermophila TaxID=72144 RepID=A0ABR4DER1_9PEZI
MVFTHSSSIPCVRQGTAEGRVWIGHWRLNTSHQSHPRLSPSNLTQRPGYSHDTTGIISLLYSMLACHHNKVLTVSSHQATASDIVRQHVYFRPKDGQGWESKPEVPTPDEILAKESDLEELPENPVDSPWPSKADYLSAQYQILRREATEGLRASVQRYADCRRKEAMTDTDDTNIYTRVYVKEYIMTTIGPLVKVSFSIERARYKIQWLLSKRLQPGKIVALSPKSDNFRKVCKLATVIQRPYNGGLDQEPPTVDLMWADPADAVIDPNLEMVMIESTRGYFESARHALVGLQQAARVDLPLDSYLIGQQTNKDGHPEFLKDNPLMDLSGLVSQITPDTEEALEQLRAYDVVNNPVPDLDGLSAMDESQLRGLCRIVSKELAIVQGPPGTGKTFTSVEAIKVMVQNRRRRRDPPIIVAAQTNHALDQILTHCLGAGISVLRLGGRTQNEEIKKHTLYEQRQKCGQLPSDRKLKPIGRQLDYVVEQLQVLKSAVFNDRLLDPDELLEHGIITKAQHASLSDDSMESHEAINDMGPFALWLGDSLIPADLRVDRHPTPPERDEAEARQNLPEFEWDDEEAIEDLDVDEENDFLLRGKSIQLRHVWTGKDPARLGSWDRAVQRALRNNDLFLIDPDLRGAVYQHFQSRLLEVVTPQFTRLLERHVQLCKERKANRFLANAELVENQRYDIVGCTTTGLSKYRGCLAAMQPVSLLIEEAAETREANVVAALYPTIQQLILVGDHKQLAPNCDIMWLGDAPYNLNVSLFERMVNLGAPYVMLNKQRRMKPELRKILMPFYEDLADHPSVTDITKRPDVPGMGGRNCWLFHHDWPENVNSDFSKFNEMEAEMIANFFAYLVANGTPPERITVLTFYKGQRKVLLGRLKRHPSIAGLSFNVCTVDSFQGEENDVILLSMVRSPQVDRPFAVGFLEDPRRAVVAISRARRGFYVFGNVENALGAHAASGKLWGDICSGFDCQGMYNKDLGLPIVCQSHHREIWIKELGDWDGNAGGCDQRCGMVRHCGHPCQISCHP